MTTTENMVPTDPPEDGDVFYIFGQAAGALATAGLNTLSTSQRRLIEQAIQGGARLVLVTDLEPLAVRGVLRLPDGEIVTAFAVKAGEPAAVH